MYDWQNSQYFKTLPAHIKETIMQSGNGFRTEDDLRKFADNLEAKNG